MGAVAMEISGYIIVIILAHVAFLGSFMAAAAASASIDLSTAVLIRVDQSGKGDFKKIQDAIDSVPPNNSQLVFIWVKPGIYREKVVVPADKPFITLSGTEASKTIITWSDGGNIFESPTLSVLASDFVGRYLTIQNTYGSGDKAVALRVSGDRAAFYGCRILSYQDTLLDDTGSHYYSNCYIEGATDFICGNAVSLFENCHLHSISKNNGSITAQHRDSSTQNSGFTFLGCKITGIGSAYLGRPWGDYSRVVFAFSYMSKAIAPAGWDTWAGQTKQSTVFYAEYKCYGPGANRAQRVEWSRSLSKEEAAPFLTKAMIGGQRWLRRAPTYFKRGSTIIKGHVGNN
ncbi:putative pectinesterase 11 [Manihot esculenta]|uniref:Uncharacterized protein n=1 Tax=Manihot esculenta TaxID=3983 RepID=A0ACB7HTL8_MANES|nr:putative pectinesterase 11 [Manihot esculenta]KAG8655993.1 hypothetical protein MANES_04G088900v8 [Manihot esculenta]